MDNLLPTNVTKAFLPEMEEYAELLNVVWKSRQLTNGGELVFRLVDQLRTFLDVPHVLPVANGTLALQLAIKALDLSGEIITTPFSYVATSSAIMWQGCKPVFADIEADHWCIDPEKIEQAITPNTTAILATHVFGNPCDVKRINDIAKKYELKVIYDAAHCFGVTYNGSSIFNFGDISICSFHATKLFHTGEGGGIFTRDADLYERLEWSHNFGHDGEENFFGLGLNAKMSEMQAAMGLAILPHVRSLIESRKKTAAIYDRMLNNGQFGHIKIRSGTEWNHGYYPILLQSETQLLAIKARLNQAGIFPRRYFYPALSTLGFLNPTTMPVAEDIASRILCLPMYHDLRDAQVEHIARIVSS